MKLYCKNLALCDSSGRLLRPEESPVFYYAENYSVEIQSLDGNFPAGQWFLALASGFSPSEAPRLAYAELELETAGATLSFNGLDCRTLGMLEATSGSPCRPGIIQCSRLAGNPAGNSLEHRLMALARLGGIACDNTLTPSAVSSNAICIGANGHWYINGIDTGVSATGGGGGTSDYNALSNKPAIEGVTLASTTSLAGIGAAASVHTHPQSDVTGLADTLAGKASLQGGTVPASQLPPIPAAAHDAAITITQGTATLGTFTTDQAVSATISIPEPPSGVSDVIVGGTSVVSGGTAAIGVPTHPEIDARAAGKLLALPGLDYAVRSVLPLVTEIPAAAATVTLTDGSSNTNNHSHTYIHAPSISPIYTLPGITDSTITHTIFLDVDMATTASLAFQDVNGNPVTPKTVSTPAVGEKWTFLAEWQFGKWQVYGVRSEVATV